MLALLEQLARLKVRQRQDACLSLNTRRFFEDSDDIEVAKLAMELRNRMGWLPQIAPPPPPLQARQTPLAPHAASTTRAPEVHRRGRPGG